MTRVDRRDVELYRNLLMDALGGPVAASLQGELGPASAPLYEALFERVDRRPVQNDDAGLDELDWTTIRVVAPAVLRLHTDSEFFLSTGFQFDDLRALLDKAISGIRRFGHIGGGVSYQIGECVVGVPVRRVAPQTTMAAVPDEASWDRVVPECAKGRRDEFLVPLRAQFLVQARNRLWEEVPAKSAQDLYEFLAERAAPWETGAKRRFGRT